MKRAGSDIKTCFKSGIISMVVPALIILLNACNYKSSAIIVTTTNVSGITRTQAESGGNITAGNRVMVTGKGVCWATTPDPTLEDNKTDEGAGAADFISKLTGLKPGTEYYVRAYCVSQLDTVFGRNLSFSTEAYPTVSDIEGNMYNVITIGKQTWMGENLRTVTFNDGSAIPLIRDESGWTALSTSACCWYNNDEEAFKQTYGALYNWYSVNTGRLCPGGWHVPGDEEWTELATFTGGEGIAGGKLKEAGTTYWVEPNFGATNEFGFSAFPGGFRYFDGKFFDFGFSGYWWSSGEYSATRAYFRFLYYNESIFYRFNNNKKNGFSVRCVKD